MISLTIAVVIENNHPWPKYSAKSLLAQIGISETKIEIFSKDSFDSSVDEFTSNLQNTLQWTSTKIQNLEEVFLKMIDSNSEFVALFAGNVYTTTDSKFLDQINLLENTNFDFCWHPVVMRNKATIELFPLNHVARYKHRNEALLANQIPWQSLVFRSTALKCLLEVNEVSNFSSLIKSSVRELRGIVLPYPLVIVQNSAGRGTYNEEYREPIKNPSGEHFLA